jgi:hypothetical protein
MSYQMPACASVIYKGQNKLTTYMTQNQLAVHTIGSYELFLATKRTDNDSLQAN